ncbi:MBL fold metallo-hydrolase [Candidatus Gottesmanbacteria bacterium]|nr:MBL fold metallo-hydrolase [Candidatus Gottesmanbacteria bacterium]
MSLAVETLVVGQMQTNCYIVSDRNSHDGVIIDPGDDAEFIESAIARFEITPKAILATHGHFDHILAALALQLAYEIPFYIHAGDEFLVKDMAGRAKHFLGIAVDPPPVISGHLRYGQDIAIGVEFLCVMDAKGHTPGSVCFHNAPNKILFVGDTIFQGGEVGRTDFSYANPLELQDSNDAIFSLDEETILYPGHGEETKVIYERRIKAMREAFLPTE